MCLFHCVSFYCYHYFWRDLMQDVAWNAIILKIILCFLILFCYNWKTFALCIQQCCSTFPCLWLIPTLHFCTNNLNAHVLFFCLCFLHWVTNASLKTGSLSPVQYVSEWRWVYWFILFFWWFHLLSRDTLSEDSSHPTANVYSSELVPVQLLKHVTRNRHVSGGYHTNENIYLISVHM